MASTPTPSKAPAYLPRFKRIGQDTCKDNPHCGDFLGEFACVATICGATLDDIRNLAIKAHHHPKHGAFWVTDALVQQLLAAYGWQGTEWKQVLTPLAGLPDVAILLIDYDETTEIGRPVVYQRAASKSKPTGFDEWIIDPAHWSAPAKQLTDDVKGYAPAWYIGVFQLPYPSSGILKSPPSATTGK